MTGRTDVRLVMVNPADTGGHQLIQIYVCDYCGAFVPAENEYGHDAYHQSRRDTVRFCRKARGGDPD